MKKILKDKLMEKFSIKKLSVVGLACFVVIQFLLMCYYEWTNYYTYLTGDIAADLFLADYMAECNEWLLCSDWVYGSEIHFLHNQLIMIPLFKVFSSYRVVMLLTFVIGVILILTAGFIVTYKMSGDVRVSLLSIALMMAPKTELYSMGFQQLFSWAYVFFTITFWALLLYRKERNYKWIMVVLCLLSFLMGMCGLRFFIILIVPLVASYCWEFFVKNLKRQEILIPKKEIAEVGAILVSAVAGFAVFYLYISKEYGSGTAVGTFWVKGEEVMENFLYTPFALLEIFGGFLRQNAVMSTRGLAQMAIYAGIIVFFFVLGYSYTKDSGKYNEKTLLVRRFLIMATVVSLVMIGFTNMGQVWGRLMEIHYLCLALIVFFPVVCALLYQSNINKLFKRMFVLLAIVYILASDAFYFAEIRDTEIPDYAKWLEESGYEYGWSYTVWDGLETIAYTDGKIEVCNVRTPEYNAANIQLSKKSYADKTPEFMLIPVGEDSDEILQNCPYAYEMVYSGDDMVIFELNEK